LYRVPFETPVAPEHSTAGMCQQIEKFLPVAFAENIPTNYRLLPSILADLKDNSKSVC
jgi:hypothetical protein